MDGRAVQARGPVFSPFSTSLVEGVVKRSGKIPSTFQAASPRVEVVTLTTLFCMALAALVLISFGFTPGGRIFRHPTKTRQADSLPGQVFVMFHMIQRMCSVFTRSWCRSFLHT